VLEESASELPVESEATVVAGGASVVGGGVYTGAGAT
jgi:hypothetical protein